MRNANRYDVVVAGYTCLDLTPEIRNSKSSAIAEIFQPGKLIEIDGISVMPGGAVPNKGMVLKKFNKKVFLNGLAGNDLISGGGGNDCIFGGYGDDIISGNSGNDTIKGNSGNDILKGQSGTDVIYSNSGSDVIDGGANSDRCYPLDSHSDLLINCEG